MTEYVMAGMRSRLSKRCTAPDVLTRRRGTHEVIAKSARILHHGLREYCTMDYKSAQLRPRRERPCPHCRGRCVHAIFSIRAILAQPQRSAADDAPRHKT